jgi:hypothetical protein
MKNKRKNLVIVILIVILLNCNTLIVGADDPQVYENEYGRLEVTPAYSNTTFWNHKQYYNITWKYSDIETVDIAFSFDHRLPSGAIYLFNGTSYNRMDTKYIGYNNKSFYVLKELTLLKDVVYSGYWEYTTGKQSGKWDLYVKRSVDTWKTAFQTGRIIHLDPWYSSDYQYMRWANMDGYLENFALELLLQYTTYFNSTIQTDFDDLRFVENNETLLYHWIDRDESTNGVECNVWVNISQCGDVATDALCVYWGNAGAADTSDGNNTFFFFDDFTGTNGNPPDSTKWYNSSANGAWSNQYLDGAGNWYVYADNNVGVSSGGIGLTTIADYDFDAFFNDLPFWVHCRTKYIPTGDKKGNVNLLWRDPNAATSDGYFSSYSYYSLDVFSDIWTAGVRDRIQNGNIVESSVFKENIVIFDTGEMNNYREDKWADNTGTDQISDDYNITIGHSVWKASNGDAEAWYDHIFICHYNTSVINGSWGGIEYLYPLEYGDAENWRLVSIPYNGTVSKYDVYIINDTGTSKNWTVAVSDGWILSYVFYWNTSTETYIITNNFLAYTGYWMYFYVSGLTLYYPGAGSGCASIDDAISYLENNTTYAAGLTFDENQYLTVIFIIIMALFAGLAETAKKQDRIRRAVNFFLAGIIGIFGAVSLTQFLPWYYSFAFLTATGFYWLRAFLNFGKVKKIT